MDLKIAGRGLLGIVKAGFASQPRGALAVIVLVAVAVVASGVSAPVSAAPLAGGYIVTLKDGIDATAFARAADARSGVDVQQVYSVALRAFQAQLTASAKAQLSQDPAVRFISSNRTFKAFAQALPTGVDRIEGDLSTVYTPGTSVATPVAVLDTGVTADPDLNVQAIGHNCVGGVGWSDLNGHGTHIAGIIAARNNADGVVGVAPGAPIYPIQVLNRSANGSDASILCGIEWLTTVGKALGVRVANLSAGTFGGDDGDCGRTNADPIHLAICNATAAGTVFVVAAGNSGGAITFTIPASYDEVLTATWMTDYNGSPSKASPPAGCDLGPDDRASTNSSWAYDDDKDHILAAPGSCITSTSNTGGTKVMSGSSMAAPHLAGTVALCIDRGACSGAPADIIQKVRADAATRPSTYGFDGDPFRPIVAQGSGITQNYGYLTYAGAY
ncbi:MAG TPA: S8 family serine peptidase [Actinomycetes bacterium]|nr:S8 family serine peptidase [Actinomycetes bacterium]